ncbi:hypothetical protein [Laceyella sacchari]|uniref:AAA+ ATPase domain-containing protein n=1 Tax=Laceyella sacchari TaxID=37482 RepID=A0ABY5U155_LACSH|nr:hypothetical protein [Laceyella sacchari]UWE03391.1 hypothetical protein NYR52_14970 [Laceyella sacchari]
MNRSNRLQRLRDVYHFDATNVKSEYFLLTHKPFRKIELVTPYMSADEKVVVNENEFLQNYLLQERERHKFIVVSGDNGSGKSHFIRWLKEMYLKNVSPEEDAIIFIARAQSTLRATLEQIIHAEVLQDHQMAEKLQSLIEANEHLGKENLKNNILHQFAIAVKEDNEETSLQVKLKKTEKRRLYDFLVSIETQTLLMREDGPIDRIYKKLASEATNEVMTEVTPRFLPEDFYVTVEQAKAIRESEASRKVQHFVEDIMEPSSRNSQEVHEVLQKRETYANYLNQFLDIVVQRCTQLRGTDLKDVLMTLRKELKKQGKNLTLFIEDITAFTGIDKALVEALIAEHEGTEVNNELCRIVSIIGITNSYFHSSFPDNLKNRISYELKMDQSALGTEDDVVELAARYINTIYLDEKEIELWNARGADVNEIPTARLYNEHLSWASCQTEEGYVLPLFPFNEKAIYQLFMMHGVRTPREFLNQVLIPYMMRFLQDPSSFPPAISEFRRRKLNVPIMDNISDEGTLNRLTGSQAEKYQSLLCIWGNQTLESIIKEGKQWIGGLEDQVFVSFGLTPLQEMISKDKTITANHANNTKANPENSIPTPKEGKNQPSLNNNTSPSVPDEVSKRQQEFKQIREELLDWMDGQPLVNDVYRERLIDVIRDTISWEAEGVPVHIVDEVLTKNRVEIEGQAISTKTKIHTLTFYRSPKLRYALEAIMAWKILGKNSWDFKDAPQYALALFTWIELEKKKIIEYVQKPSEISVSNWRADEWAVAAEFYLRVLSGHFTSDIQIEPRSLYELLLLQPKEITMESDRASAWGNLQSLLKQNDMTVKHTEEGFLRFFNRTQGSVKERRSTDKFILDSGQILQVIKQLIQSDFDIEKLALPKKKESPLAWYRSINLLYLIKSRLQNAFEEEKKRVEDTREEIRQILGDVSTETEMQSLHLQMIKTLKFFVDKKEPFDQDLQQNIVQDPFFTHHLVTFITQAERLKQGKTRTEQLLVLSSNPVKEVDKYLETLKKFNRLLDGIKNKYSARVQNAPSSFENEQDWQEARNHLEKLKIELNKLEEV